VWWRDVIREATFQGFHTPVVQLGLRYGMALFIASEVMFFSAFFWAFFSSSLFPVGGVWPPKGIHPFDPFSLPFLNTLILLLSGTTVTWAHHALIEGDRRGLIQGLTLTVLLGISFTCIQAYEYAHAAFTFRFDAGTPVGRDYLAAAPGASAGPPAPPRDGRSDIGDLLGCFTF